MRLIKQWRRNFKLWRDNQRLLKAANLIRKVAHHPIGYEGVSRKSGTVYRLKDINYNLRKQTIDYKYIKVRRGTRTNKYLKNGHTADQR